MDKNPYELYMEHIYPWFTQEVRSQEVIFACESDAAEEYEPFVESVQQSFDMEDRIRVLQGIDSAKPQRTLALIGPTLSEEVNPSDLLPSLSGAAEKKGILLEELRDLTAHSLCLARQAFYTVQNEATVDNLIRHYFLLFDWSSFDHDACADFDFFFLQYPEYDERLCFTAVRRHQQAYLYVNDLHLNGIPILSDHSGIIYARHLHDRYVEQFESMPITMQSTRALFLSSIYAKNVKHARNYLHSLQSFRDPKFVTFVKMFNLILEK